MEGQNIIKSLHDISKALEKSFHSLPFPNPFLRTKGTLRSPSMPPAVLPSYADAACVWNEFLGNRFQESRNRHLSLQVQLSAFPVSFWVKCNMNFNSMMYQASMIYLVVLIVDVAVIFCFGRVLEPAELWKLWGACLSEQISC